MSTVGEIDISISPIPWGKIANNEVLVTRHGVRAAYRWPMVIHKAPHLLVIRRDDASL
jgi:hypothetical protein